MNNYENAIAMLLPLIPYAPFCTAIQNLYEHCKTGLKKLKRRTLASLILPTKNIHIGYDNCLMKENGEHLILKTLIQTGDIVFDVGANAGEWSSHVLALKKYVTIHAFEPIPSLCEKLYNIIDKNRVHNLALSNTCGRETLYCYNNHRLSSLYERKSAHLQPKQIIQISADTLSNVCAKYDIDTINYLKIDTEGAELFVLQGAQELIHNHMIELIQFEYGGTYKDAGTTLRQVYDLLTQAGYKIYRIVPQGLEYLDAWNDYLECFKYSNYLAVCPDFME
jgi:FkbM family methyltransferase